MAKPKGQQAKQGDTKVKGCKKCNREKKKRARKGSPISSYVRGRITAKEYFVLTNQACKSA